MQKPEMLVGSIFVNFMTTLGNKIIDLLKQTPGLSDREITDTILGSEAPQQSINQICRGLESRGILIRQRKENGRIGNYLTGKSSILKFPQNLKVNPSENLSEDRIKQALRVYLDSQGWVTTIAWGKTQGIDIEAKRGLERWIIEVKGQGSLQPMRVNYFLSILGETLQRMDDPDSKYSIALPNMAQFRGLWDRLPKLAKERTEVTALFVDINGKVIENP